MLKLLVRLTAFGVSIFLATLAGIFLAAGEDGFPWGTDHSASLDFSQSQLTKDEAIGELDSLVDSSGLRLGKLVADPQNFLTSKSLYVFGNAAGHGPKELNWFRAEMSGELRAASTLGDASLDGTYVYSGSDAATAGLIEWADEVGVQTTVAVKTIPAVLSYALLNTGAWLPLLTSILLLISLTVSWYVLRARARTIKVLNGTRVSSILAEDLTSLLRISIPPALLGFAGALAVIAISGKSPYLFQFASTTLAFLGFALAAMILSALLVSVMTWPTVAGIASRLPPERHFKLVSETLKVGTLILVAVSLPAVGSAIATASHLSDQGARWEALTGQVSVRVGTSSIEEFDAHMPDMDKLIQDASTHGVLTFSFAQNAFDFPAIRAGGFEGLIMVNPAYLEAVGPIMGLSGQAGQPLGGQGTAVPLAELPTDLTEYLSSSFELWNREGRNLEGMDKNFVPYRYTGSETFPGLAPVAGEMENFKNPLIIVVDDPAATFNTSFLSSALSSGNLMVSDSKWLHKYLAKSALAEVVLSVDRVSDSGLYFSQQQSQTAGMRSLSYALVVLALVASIAVSAWIYALARGRRLFVQRTSGWAWARILVRRLVWEAALATAVATAVLVTSNVAERPEAWWTLGAIPIYITISAVLHLTAVKSVFSRRLARVE